MDAIEILGTLLGSGRRAPTGGEGGGGGLGGRTLDQMFGQERKSAPSGSARPTPIDQQARELEDLLGVAKGRAGGATPKAQPAPKQAPVTKAQPMPTAPAPPMSPQSGPRFDQFDASPRPMGKSKPAATTPSPIPGPLDPNGEAMLLIRAMIAAAKSDGRVTQEEQQAILSRIGQPDQEVLGFLQQEFSKPLDVRELAWSVPLGLEPKVYMMSLAAIELDTQSEATYLKELAHGLRMAPQLCNEIHAKFNAPPIF